MLKPRPALCATEKHDASVFFFSGRLLAGYADNENNWLVVGGETLIVVGEIVAASASPAPFTPVLTWESDNSHTVTPDKSTRAGITLEVQRYIKAKGLTLLLDEALEHLDLAFGVSLQPNYRMFSDPGEGGEMLFIDVPTTDLKSARRQLSQFNYDWWYDKIGDVGHLIGFRVVKARGV